MGEGRGGRRGSILAQVVYLPDGYPVHYIGDGLGGGRDGEDDGFTAVEGLGQWTIADLVGYRKRCKWQGGGTFSATGVIYIHNRRLATQRLLIL